MGLAAAELEALAHVCYADDDLAAAISSGSFLTDGMLVIPCSIGSAGAIAHSPNANLLVRVAEEYAPPAIYVTENGACYDDPLAADGTVHDDDRIAYLREHLAARRAA